MDADRGGDTASISLLREIRGQVFVWIGIVGGALTIVGDWSSFITVADWMRWLVSHFTDVMHAFWKWIGSLLHVTISKELGKSLSFIAFFSSITFGSIVIGSGVRKDNTKIGVLATAIFVALLIPIVFINRFKENVILIGLDLNMNWTTVCASVLFMISTGVIVSGSLRQRAAITMLMITMCVLTFNLMIGVEIVVMNLFVAINSGLGKPFEDLIEALLLSVILFTPLFVAPTNALIKRLTFLLIGVAIIFGLSGVSKVAENLRMATTSIEAPR